MLGGRMSASDHDQPAHCDMMCVCCDASEGSRSSPFRKMHVIGDFGNRRNAKGSGQ